MGSLFIVGFGIVGMLVGIYLLLSGLFRGSLFWIAPSWGSALLRLLMGGLAVVAHIRVLGFQVLRRIDGDRVRREDRRIG